MSFKIARIAGTAAVLTLLLAGPVLAENAGPMRETSSTSSTIESLKDQRKALEDRIKAEREKARADKAAATAAQAEAARACVAAAVDKREVAIAAGWSAYASGTTANLAARRTALAAAWAMTDRAARRTAISAAWKTANEAQRATLKTWRAAKKSAWEQSSKDRRACGPSAASEMSESANADASL